MALEDQMSMNFGDIPDNTVGVDPVSGNEIPLGSTAENVRDDIPANLSEGEIVIPADVVNFHGVKLFEDLRAEAKMGYAQMSEDGRIGGEPMDEPIDDNELGLEISDLEIFESMEEPVTMNEGGSASKEPKFKNRYEKIMYYLSQLMKEKEEEEKKLKGTPIAEQINFGGKYNEGGMASDEQPFYTQKGGFDMSRADVPVGSPIGDMGTVSTGMVELREYMNDAGHKIVITFVDGEPTTEIPVGYYPVSTIVTPSSSVSTDSDKDSNSSMPVAESINYKELSLQELTDMVQGQQDSKITNTLSRLAMGANPIMGIFMKVAMADQSRKLKNEIQRRLDDTATTDIDRMKLNNLVEIEGKSTFLERLFGKETSKMIAKPKDNEAFIAAAITDPEKFLPPTPDVYEPEVTTPKITTPETINKSTAQMIQDSIDIKRIQDEMESKPRPAKPNPFGGSTYDEVSQVEKGSDPEPSYTVNTPTVRDDSRKERDAQRRRDKQESNKNITGSTARKTDVARSATRGLSTTEKKGGGGLDSRFGISGIAKGGIMSTKKKKAKNKK